MDEHDSPFSRAVESMNLTHPPVFVEALQDFVQLRPGTTGKGAMTPELAQLNQRLANYRQAMDDALGAAASSRYELLCFSTFMGSSFAGLAHCADDQCAYMLYPENELPSFVDSATWLLDVAKELTLLTRTLVVPDQASDDLFSWPSQPHGYIIAFQFKLADAPASIRI